MTADPDIDRIEIFKSHFVGDLTPRWFLNMCLTDGLECIIDDKTNYADAWISALESGAHIVDLDRPLGTR